MPVKLHGRSHPVHKACKDGLPYGIRASLDPPCSYSPTFSSAAQRWIARDSCPGCRADAHPLSLGPPGACHARSGLSHDALPPLRPKTWMPAARAEPSGDSHGSALRWIHFVNPRRELKSIRDPLRCSRRTLGSLPARLPPRNWNLTNGLLDLGPKRQLLVAMHLSLS